MTTYYDEKEKDLHIDHIDEVPKLSGKNTELNTSAYHVKQVANADLFAAVQESTIPKWSKSSIHLYFSVFIAFSCACANGYDGSLMTAILAMKPFQNTFNCGTTGIKVSIIFSLYTVGSMVGAPFAAILSDRYGRRKGMFVGAVIIILGMVVCVSGKTVGQLVAGRFILGLGISIMTVAAPAYSMEIAPPQWRGRCTGFYNTGWFGGSIPAAAITFGTNFIDNDLCWQIPLIFQAFACVIVMGGVFFIPESPRFLMANGRTDEARDFLIKYHGNGDPSSKLVALEMHEMEDNIRLDGIDKRWWDYRPLFLTKNGRWRMAQVLMISIFGQFSGNGLGYFNTVIYNNLGITSVVQQLGYNLMTSFISAFVALVSVSLTDRMPRRKVLVIGTFICAIMLAINSGLSAVLASEGTNFKKSVGQGALAAYFLFGFIYTFTYTPLQGVIPAEALETTMRAKGLAASGVIVSAVGFINQFATPIALEPSKMGYKFIYIFVGWDIVESIMWYLFCVESQGRTLEELEWVYSQPNPVKASLQAVNIVVSEDGTVTGVVDSDAL